jgi:hypothetical protein
MSLRSRFYLSLSSSSSIVSTPRAAVEMPIARVHTSRLVCGGLDHDEVGRYMHNAREIIIVPFKIQGKGPVRVANRALRRLTGWGSAKRTVHTVWSCQICRG